MVAPRRRHDHRELRVGAVRVLDLHADGPLDWLAGSQRDGGNESIKARAVERARKQRGARHGGRHRARPKKRPSAVRGEVVRPDTQIVEIERRGLATTAGDDVDALRLATDVLGRYRRIGHDQLFVQP
ncbi:hypothetical protein CMK11_06335 [Candidatus Poribacteria bacterium]|nr:hypothetical protein [Candidatus Poribacteria bacterium]